MIIEFVFELSHDGIGVIDVVGVSVGVGVAARLGSFFGLFSRRCLKKMSYMQELKGRCKSGIPANSLKIGLIGALTQHSRNDLKEIMC